VSAALEQAWRELDAAERAIPDCPHVRAWKGQITAARERYRAALRTTDAEAASNRRPGDATCGNAELPQVRSFDDDGALFPLEGAA